MWLLAVRLHKPELSAINHILERDSWVLPLLAGCLANAGYLGDSHCL